MKGKTIQKKSIGKLVDRKCKSINPLWYRGTSFVNLKCPDFVTAIYLTKQLQIQKPILFVFSRYWFVRGKKVH